MDCSRPESVPLRLGGRQDDSRILYAFEHAPQQSAIGHSSQTAEPFVDQEQCGDRFSLLGCNCVKTNAAV
jgi:hypothetical protein